MDEIVIEEKKYISSKRAAKITGYAKDYIGQLCREGRVPARLVGRNWYVLETAIQDHRFGDSESEEIEQEKALKSEKTARTTVRPETDTILSPTWEAPRYESVSEEVLTTNNTTQDIQESWQAWFDHFGNTENLPKYEEKDAIEADSEQEPEPEEGSEQRTELKEEPEEENSATNVPIHVHSDETARIIPTELLPRHFEMEPEEEHKEDSIPVKRRRGKMSSGIIINTIQTCGILLALVMIVLAVMNSGYFDKYLVSNSQVRMLAGVSLYNK
jgi:hypothetical protein